LPTGDDDLGIAVADRLRREHHGLQARAADGVDRERRHALRQAALDDGLARRVLARAGGQHLAEDQLVDLVAAQLCAAQQVDDDGGAQFGRRGLGERAAELADCGAGGGDDDDVGGHGVFSRGFDEKGVEGAVRGAAQLAFCFT
jgi:hypothetical protein